MRAAVSRAGSTRGRVTSTATTSIALVLFLVAIATPAQDRESSGTATDEQESQTASGPSNPLEKDRTAAALAGLEEQAELGESLIAGAVEAYDQAVTDRNAAQQRLAQEQQRLDELIGDEGRLTARELSARTNALEQARADVAARESDVGRRLDDLRRLLDQREALAEHIALLRQRMPAEREFLTGVWEVRWFPAGVTGTFFIDQSGTLVTGQYRLRPLGSGSLQGTFVGGKLRLQRIDRERGRDAELEGFVDADGRQIRGTWQGYELVQGGIPHGQWVARRVN